MSLRLLLVSSFALALLASTGCENASRSGNNLTCHGGSCSTGCDAIGADTACNVICEPGASCDARCNAGQSCNFECQGDARCMFDCANGSCQVNGAGEGCSCSGTCPGTCTLGSTTPLDAGAGGDSCADLCGDPSEPGYATCIAACG